MVISFFWASSLIGRTAVSKTVSCSSSLCWPAIPLLSNRLGRRTLTPEVLVRVQIAEVCSCGGKGRRKGLKIPGHNCHLGSSPSRSILASWSKG